jgi:hypothetical protein
MTVQQPASKAKSMPITKVGHTVGNKFGMNSMAKERGNATPTDVSFGK